MTHEHMHGCGCEDCGNGHDPEFSTVGELNGDNTTGKPNFNWAQAAEQISRDDRKWDGGALGSSGSVTYSFLSDAEAGADFDRLTTAQTDAALTAMRLWSEVANIDFRAAGGGSNVSNNGEMTFKGYDGGGGGFASWSMRGGGETLAMNNATVALGGNSLSLALHEVGHAIGLSHPGDYNGGGNIYARDAEFYQDSDQYTVMSYWNGANTGADLGKFVFNANGQGTYVGGATGLGLYDIAAIQRVYGANDDTYNTNTTYGFNSTTGDDGWTLTGRKDWVNAAIWDTGGTDTIDMSRYLEDAEIDLRQESFSSTGGLTFNLAIAKGAVIENAIGGRGDDAIIGNSARNDIDGGSGRDDIEAGAGNDTVRGGRGNDRLDGGAANDMLWGDNGRDAMFGGTGNDRLDGGAGNDILSGGGGRDTLIGSLGNDKMTGGGGDDTFLFALNSGNDQVLDFTLGSDRLQFDVSGLDFNDLSITKAGRDAMVDYGSGEVKLIGVNAGQLDESDFLFT